MINTKKSLNYGTGNATCKCIIKLNIRHQNQTGQFPNWRDLLTQDESTDKYGV